MLEAAYDSVAAALEAGELVAIFPEGRITDTGALALAKSPYLPRLRMVDLFGCRIRQNGAAAKELHMRFGDCF